MMKRVVTSVIWLPFLIVFVVSGGLFLKLALIALSLIGMSEVYLALSKKHLRVHFVGYIFCIVYVLLIDDPFFKSLNMITSLFIISILIFLVVNHTKTSIIDCAVTMFGFYYVVFLLSNIYLVREFTYNEAPIGIFFVWLIFICAWVCDTGAYFVGTTMGKHKLTPLLSPNKTVEGAVGGVLFAALGAFIYSFIVSRLYVIENVNIIIFCVIIGIVGSIFAQLGDLSASAIKRFTGIKDYGKIFPGHGGVIDRFDSVIFTSPIVYLVIRLLFTLK